MEIIKNNDGKNKFIGVGLLIVLLLQLSCSEPNISDIDYVTNAETALANNEIRTAIIHLKNALKNNPQNIQARGLLGQVYLEIGGGAEAEKEIEKAIELGLNGEQIFTQWIHALLIQKKYAKAVDIISKYQKTSPTKSESMTVLKGDALFFQDKALEAKKIYEALEASGSQLVGVFIGLAKIAFFEQKVERSLGYLEKAKLIDANSVELLFVEAEIAMSTSQYKKAEGIYEGIVFREKPRKITRNLLISLVGLVKSQLAQNKIQAAKIVVAELETLNKNSVLLKYIKGVIAFRSGYYNDAQGHLLDVMRVNEKFSPALLLLATSNFALANFEQASDQLNRFLLMNPGHIEASKLFAITQIRLNQPKAAVESLNSLVDNSTEDAELIALLGQAVLQSGDILKGTRLLQSAVDAGGVKSRLQLASIYLAQGNVTKALEELGKNGNKKTSFHQKSLMVIAHLQAQHDVKAESKAKEIIKDYPDDARAFNLLGAVYLIKKSFVEAEKQFRIALNKDSSFLAAWKNIAIINMELTQYDGATLAFNSVLKLNPNDVDALVGLAKINEKQGNQEKAIEFLIKAKKSDVKAEKPKVLLGRYFMRKGDFKQALELEKELSKIANPSSHTLAFQGALLLNVGDNKSISIYRTLSEREPDNYFWHYRHGLALVRFNHPADALSAIKRSTSIKPDFLQASSLLVSIYVQLDKYVEAENIIKDIRRLNPNSPAGNSLMGDLLIVKREYEAASVSYQLALEKFKNTALLLKYVGALDKAGMQKKLENTLLTWLEHNEKDQDVRVFYANYLSLAGENEKSIREYRNVLEINDKNVAALNNLANLLYDSEQKTEARKLAEKAYNLASNVAEVIDSFGWILFRDGDIDRSIELLRKAAEKAPAINEIKYHLAEALVKGNQKEQARNILIKILNKGDFKSKKRAKELLEMIH